MTMKNDMPRILAWLDANSDLELPRITAAKLRQLSAPVVSSDVEAMCDTLAQDAEWAESIGCIETAENLNAAIRKLRRLTVEKANLGEQLFHKERTLQEAEAAQTEDAYVAVGWITQDGFAALKGSKPVMPNSTLFALRKDCV